jgi:hypothetical protein
MRGQKRRITLTSEAKEALIKGFQHGTKPIFRERCHYILLSHQGYSIRAISTLYQCTYHSVLTWYNRYETEGITGLYTRKGQGCPPIIRIETESDKAKLEDLIALQDKQKLKSHLISQFGELSDSTLTRF